MEDKKSYYAIIPANVRYDDSLCANAKLLYGEISALCNEKGYCWASNDYFSKLYKATKKSISTWIRNLRERGYITVEVKYKENRKEIINRYIKIITPMEENFHRYGKNLPEGIEENFHTPMEEKVKDNNTSLNNTSNNTNEKDYIGTNSGQTSAIRPQRFQKPTIDQIADYCKERENTIDPQQFFDYYEANGWHVGRNPMKDWKSAVRYWERNQKGNQNGTARKSEPWKDPWDDPDYYKKGNVR